MRSFRMYVATVAALKHGRLGRPQRRPRFAPAARANPPLIAAEQNAAGGAPAMAAMEATATASSRIQKHDNRLQVDLTGCSFEELLALCAECAAFCATTRMRGALLKGGDEDVRRCVAVRDLLKILMLVVRPDFHIALVPSTPRAAAVYRKYEAELRGAGMNARFFESEALATQWFVSA